MPQGCRRIVLVLSTLTAGSQTAAAQAAPDTPVTALALPIAAWVSAGLGWGRIRRSSGLLAGTVRGNVSAGQLLVTYRVTGVTDVYGSPNLLERGLLLGMRTSDTRAFVSASLGAGHVSISGAPPLSALAFEGVVHADYPCGGAFASLSGSLGPERVRNGAFTVGLEIGWFGR